MANNNESSVEALTACEVKLDEFHSSCEKCLFEQISDPKYAAIIIANPELEVTLQDLCDQEVELRMKIHRMKSLVEMKKEIEQLASDKNVRAKAIQAQEDRLKATQSMMEGK